MYNAALANYDSAVDTYETDKKAFEDYITAVSTDPSTAVVVNPKQPWTLAAYSGIKFNECITSLLETNLDKCNAAALTALKGTGDATT